MSKIFLPQHTPGLMKPSFLDSCFEPLLLPTSSQFVPFARITEPLLIHGPPVQLSIAFDVSYSEVSLCVFKFQISDKRILSHLNLHSQDTNPRSSWVGYVICIPCMSTNTHHPLQICHRSRPHFSPRRPSSPTPASPIHRHHIDHPHYRARTDLKSPRL